MSAAEQPLSEEVSDGLKGASAFLIEAEAPDFLVSAVEMAISLLAHIEAVHPHVFLEVQQ